MTPKKRLAERLIRQKDGKDGDSYDAFLTAFRLDRNNDDAANGLVTTVEGLKKCVDELKKLGRWTAFAQKNDLKCYFFGFGKFRGEWNILCCAHRWFL